LKTISVFYGIDLLPDFLQKIKTLFFQLVTNERDMLKKDVKRMERDKQLYGKNNNNNNRNRFLQIIKKEMLKNTSPDDISNGFRKLFYIPTLKLFLILHFIVAKTQIVILKIRFVIICITFLQNILYFSNAIFRGFGFSDRSVPPAPLPSQDGFGHRLRNCIWKIRYFFVCHLKSNFSL